MRFLRGAVRIGAQLTSSRSRGSRGVLLAVSAATLALAGCTAAAEPPLLDSNLMIDEYHLTVDSFPEELPPGVSFSNDVPSSFDLTGQSEPGVGESFAYFYWACAWQAHYIEALEAQDKPAQTEALDQLERWTTTDFYRDHYDDPQDIWTTMIVDPARAGNPAELIAYFENGCAYYTENNPTT